MDICKLKLWMEGKITAGEWLSRPSPLNGDTNGRKGRASNVPAKVGYFGGNSLFAPKRVPL